MANGERVKCVNTDNSKLLYYMFICITVSIEGTV